MGVKGKEENTESEKKKRCLLFVANPIKAPFFMVNHVSKFFSFL
jgi:hypothetical protein